MPNLLRRRLLSTAILLAIADFGQAVAATGTITVVIRQPSGDAPITKSTNITGPTFIHAGATGTFTATFPNLTNGNGWIESDMTDVGYESLCDNTFQAIVSNGVCNITLGVSRGGQGNAVCTYTLGAVNHQTCDFTASFSNTAGTASGPPH